MKLPEPPTVFWETMIFFSLISFSGRNRDVRARQRPRMSVFSATLVIKNPTRNNLIDDGDRRYAIYYTPTHNSLSTVEVLQFY